MRRAAGAMTEASRYWRIGPHPDIPPGTYSLDELRKLGVEVTNENTYWSEPLKDGEVCVDAGGDVELHEIRLTRS
jgi:hypothetical protein